MKNRMRFGWVVAVAFVLMLAACAPAPAPVPPAIKIDAPPSNSQVAAGQEVLVQVSASDPRGVVKVELQVDGVLVTTANAPGPQASFTVVLPWKAAGPGSHIVSVRSTNQDGIGSEPAAITLIVAGADGPTGTPTVAVTRAVTATAVAPTAAPTAVPPTGVPPTPTTPPCRYVATFISETVKDGTQLLPGQQFNKSWTVRNDGNCAWNRAFALMHIDGERMAPVAGIQVPDTPPGGTVALTVAMTAPGQPGPHGGRWQLRTPQSVAFGPYLSVNIITAAPTPVPCIPNISSFGADRTTINRGESTTLRWGKVDSADRVEIDNGIGGVGTPGDRIVAPNQTTPYTLYAYCGGNTRTAQVTITVIQPQPTQPPQRVNLTGNWSAQGYLMELEEAIGCMQLPCGYRGRWIKITQGAPQIAEFTQGLLDSNRRLTITVPGSIPGQPPLYFNGTASEDGRTITGSWTRGSESGQLTFGKQ